MFAIRRNSHGIQALPGGIQGGGRTPLWVGGQGFEWKSALAVAGLLALTALEQWRSQAVRTLCTLMPLIDL